MKLKNQRKESEVESIEREVKRMLDTKNVQN